MSEPFTPDMIARFLRGSPADELARLRPVDFQRWPVRRIVPAKVIRELIHNEQSRRRRLA